MTGAAAQGRIALPSRGEDRLPPGPSLHARIDAPVTRSAAWPAAFARYDFYDLAVAALMLALVWLALATFNSYAISNDEGVQQHYGELIVAYYRSGFADKDLFHYVNLYLYGGLFDVVAVLIQRSLPFFEPYAIRHVLCALTGIAGVGGAWATARLVAGPRAGALAALMLSVCGPW